MSYEIHNDFRKYKFFKLPLNALILPPINLLMTRVLYRTPVGKGLIETRHSIAGYQGGSVCLSIISPDQCNADLPALVYFHGGAFAFQAAPYLKRLAAEYALKTPCKVVFVDYRLLPNATYPTGLEDCYSTYKWVRENAKMLGVDPERIAVGGDSAGGALAIGVCLLALERKLTIPCFQMLIYPVTDAKQETPSMLEYRDTPLWNSKLNAKMWRMYLKNVHPGKRAGASPAEAPSLAGMPPAYVEVSAFDCLRDEGIAFAERLSKYGIAVDLCKTKGTIHGFEIAKRNEIVRESIARRIDTLQKAFKIGN